MKATELSNLPVHPSEVPAGKPHKWALWLARQYDKGPRSLELNLAVPRQDAESSFERALRLVHDVYVKKQYIAPRPSGLHLNLFLLLPRSRTFMIHVGHRVIGTLSVVLDSPFGLPVDALYPEALEQLRQSLPVPSEEVAMLSQLFWDSTDFAPLEKFVNLESTRIGELTAFALDEAFQSHTVSSASISLELMRTSYKYSVMAGVCGYVVEVNRSHAQFYERFWGFKTIATGRVFPADQEPAVAMNCSPLELTKNFAEAEKSAGGIESLLLLKQREHDVLAAAVQVPLMSADTLRYFLEHRFHPEEPSVWERAAPPERAAFEKAYQPFGYDFSWAHHDR